jgi:DEAD/DEAH box helicase domain-containing protein
VTDCDVVAAADVVPLATRAAEGLERTRRRAMAGPPAAGRVAEVVAGLLADPRRARRIVHLEVASARPSRAGSWPPFVPDPVVGALAGCGIAAPWRHQQRVAELAWAGRSAVLATGTGSGKSLAYQLPALSAAEREGGTTLYLSPTKALAGDQLRFLRELGLPGAAPASYDGDCDREERDWARANARIVLTNPEMLHRSLLPDHERWAHWLRRLRFVVIDECHGYRGVFGAHVAALLRRLTRVAAGYGAAPTFLLMSATVADPAEAASRLAGVPVAAVTEDDSPAGPRLLLLWDPAAGSEPGRRRSAAGDTAELLADFVAAGLRTVAFVRSRRAAEALAMTARRRLAERDPAQVCRLSAYRAGYLPEERRAIERALRTGEVVGLCATRALELGVDVSGLDAVIISGYPGSRAALAQQSGRAGRAGRPGLTVLVARDDPLDGYLIRHPDALIRAPLESTVLDPTNPVVLAPHLTAAAVELPLRPEELPLFGPTARGVVRGLTARRVLRRRERGWFPTGVHPADAVDLRGAGQPVRIVEESTGRLLGTVDEAAAPATVHPGAVYVHQGVSYLVGSLHPAERVATAEAATVDYTTLARQVTAVRLLREDRRLAGDGVALCYGTADVRRTVVSFLRRNLETGAVLGEERLDLPERRLGTWAVWWQVDAAAVTAAAVPPAALPGALHAAEHAALGLLPLFATCDRQDVAGAALTGQPDTGAATVVVFDAHPGGAGFAERGFSAALPWLTAASTAVRSCGCADGCPSCVYSPTCGVGNEPLDKGACGRLLERVITGLSGAG